MDHNPFRAQEFHGHSQQNTQPMYQQANYTSPTGYGNNDSNTGYGGFGFQPSQQQQQPQQQPYAQPTQVMYQQPMTNMPYQQSQQPQQQPLFHQQQQQSFPPQQQQFQPQQQQFQPQQQQFQPQQQQFQPQQQFPQLQSLQQPLQPSPQPSFYTSQPMQPNLHQQYDPNNFYIPATFGQTVSHQAKHPPVDARTWLKSGSVRKVDCPVCHKTIEGDDPAINHHVNEHYS
ncbi:hypothetical protein EC973_005963 [Apophysomyces ossiformis]|uniref:Uncharacterized protein n=1 Tax=Apophysomyces ossiformis TaxID=679940 RepID=A0A8H7BWI4_9FUNG|nr:hypothetical protein EC973_005963 [Apophysomyces ossiformis]